MKTHLQVAAGAAVLVVTAPLTAVAVVIGMGAASSDAAGAADVPAPANLRAGAVPKEYREMVAKAGRVCREVTAPIIAAQINAESHWRTDAVSPDGAQGLTQFMPGTWREVGADGNGNGIASPFEPADAIATQAKYMCSLVRQVKNAKLKGSVLNLALASYNAGFGAVLRYRGIPPYPETQKYVRDIRAGAARYTDKVPPAGAEAAGAWRVPARGEATSGFGPRWDEMHAGFDIAAPVGAPIRAAASGTVVAAGPVSGGFGRWVKLSHGGGVETVYAHVSAVHVRVRQRVKGGQRIARMGSEGRSTGPHLHFEVRVGGAGVDPVQFYAARGVVLDPSAPVARSR